MPKRRSESPWRVGVARLLAATACVAAAAACESTPCVGDACPNACNGVACDEPDAAPSQTATTPGRFSACGSDASCDTASGFECVGGTCRHACQSHFDCGGVGVCET